MLKYRHGFYFPELVLWKRDVQFRSWQDNGTTNVYGLEWSRKDKKIKDDFNSVNSVFDKPELIDLNGGTVLPGMTDSHIHLSGYADSLREIDLFRCISEEDVIKTLKEKKKKIKKG